MTHMQAGPETLDIDRFIRETEFAGYQRITLPDGRVIPGTDRSPTADLVFPADLTGKTVLDVGCNYGFFLQEAIRRGAKRAVGIEANPDSFRVASTLATLWKGRIEIHQGLLEEVQLNEKFDLVIFLNVIHHVTDPVPVVKKLASLCRGTLIVEFRQPHDSQFVHECFHKEKVPTRVRRSLIRRIANRIRIATETRLMELATKRLPIIGVGSVEYDRSYFFSQRGFTNMFQIHNRLFKRVEFRPSVTRGQTLAVCDCSEAGSA
ncbi:MAG TPA: methyltransferase domain-containing protein [Gemmatimonadales bacterium]|nr:methyltransferase domain-containing protein [Gemmatimonadales bacterium]